MKKVLLIIILMIIGVTNTKAISLKRDYYDNIYYVQNGLPDYYMSDKQFHLSFNNLNAYCLDPKLKIMSYDYEEGTLDDLSFSNEVKDYLNKVIYYGYDYPGHQDVRYYMATQAIIWEYLSDFVVQFFTQQYGYGNSIDISEEKNEILTLVSMHNKLPSFANKNETAENVETVIHTDDLLRSYEIIESNYSNVKIVDNQLIIDKLKFYVGTVNIKFKRKSYRTDAPRLYFKDGSQRMMSGGRIDGPVFTYSLTIEGSDVTINKLDNDSNKKIINSDVVINIQNTLSKEFIYVDGSKDIHIPKDGFITIHDVPHGSYYITEVSTSNEYKLNNEKIRINVNDDVEVNLYNEKEKGNINITKFKEKYDYGNSSYSYELGNDIKFNLCALEDIVTKDEVVHYRKDELVNTCITKDGICKFDNLILGKYYVKEEVPNGYVDEERVYTVNLKENKNISIEIKNNLKKNSLIVNKKDIDSKLLIKTSEVYINIKDANNNYIYVDGNKDIKVPDDGVLKVEDIPEGVYTIKEISTNNEYKLNGQAIEVDLYKDMKIDLYNEKEKGSINITKFKEKYDYGNSSYSYELGNDIKFNLCALEDIVTKDEVVHYRKDELVNTCVTKDGICMFDDLILGKYYVKEEVPDIYIDEDRVYIFDLRENKNISTKIKNDLKKNDLIIEKVDSLTDEPLENVLFEIFYNSDSIGIFKTDKDGKIIVKDLPIGVYEVLEKETIYGYILDEGKKLLDLNENNTLKISNSKKLIIPNALSNENSFSKYIFSGMMEIVILICLKYLR